MTCTRIAPIPDPSDYYTCAFYSDMPAKGIPKSLYPGFIFDNCVHSIVPPSVSLTATPNPVIAGSSTTLSWTVAHATTCTASGNWSGGKTATTGTHTQVVTPPSVPGIYTYTITCSGVVAPPAVSNISVTVNPPPDTTPPDPPTGLNAIPMSTSQINLSWTAATDPPPNATGIGMYRIERCTGAIAACTTGPFSDIGSSTTLSFSSTGLSPSTTYTYRVRAYDNAVPPNPGNYSGLADATTNTPPDSIQPVFPANALSGAIISSTQINLSWLAATDNVAVVSYEVYRNNSPIAMLASSALSFSDTGLSPSTTYNYFIRARDAAGNQRDSNTLPLTTDALPDITPPTFSFTSPAILLPSGTTGATLAGTTAGDPSTCRYSTADVVFASMTTFSSDMAGDTTMHSQSITGLTDGGTYIYYVRCRDVLGNTNTTSVPHSFQVDSPAPDLTPPAVNITAPSGTLAPNTTSTTLTVITGENAFCKYNLGSDASYDTMPPANSLSGSGTVHAATLSGLSNGTSYTVFVRCQDTPAGNESVPNIYTTFFIPFPPNMNPTALFTASPASGVAPLDVAVNSTSYDIDGTIILYTWAWGDSSPNTIGSSVTAASHAYVNPGTYTITLTILDNQGGDGSATQQVVVSAPPVPPGPASTSLFCAPLCTTDADCGSGNVCSLAGICIASPASGVGPARSNGYMSLSDGSMSQEAGPFALATAVFPSYVKSAIMSLETTDPAECQYTTSVGASYGSSAMQTFDNTGTTKHSVMLTGLSGTMTASKSYVYRVLCRDLGTGETNPSTDPYLITFEIGGATILTGWPQNYTCLINKNFVSNNIPYVFDICIPK